MSATPAKPILVGVDASPASQNAVRWAAHEASRRKLPLTLVHAGYYLYEPALSAATVCEAGREIAHYARMLIDRALESVTEVDSGIEVHTELQAESPAKLLLSLAESATMIVVGSHTDGSISGAILGSISQTVAAHAHHTEPPNAERKRVVVVGVSPTPGGQQALRFAFEEARARGCTIVAIRSWGDVGWGSLALTDSEMLIQDWQMAESKRLDECLSPLISDFPDVPVERRLVGVRAQWALEEAAIGADLLVVGCHRPDDHWFSRLGPVASWLLHRSPCPIAVVGRPHHAEAGRPAPAAQRGEQAGSTPAPVS